MSSFGAKGLTNKGRVLQAKAQAGSQLKYTKFVLGDGQLAGQSIATLINVVSPKKTVEVSRLKMNPPDQAMVGFVLSNQDVATGFYFRELGLYALDPDEGEILYWYANAGDTADYIPPTNTGDVVNKTIDMLVYVGTASNVTLTIDQNLAYVTHDELDEALAGLDPDIPDASLTEKGKVQLSSATNSTSESMAATPKAVKAAYDRADAAFTSASEGKGKVRDAITGVKGTVADADGDGVPTYDELVTGVKSIPAGFTADATAAAGDIRSGKTAYKGAAKVTGTLVTQATGAQTVTPGTSNIVKPAGIYDGAITILGDADLISGNFPKDVSLFGIQGVLERLTTADRNAIIAAIVAKGVAAGSSDTNAQLATKIGQINTGSRTYYNLSDSYFRNGLTYTDMITVPAGKTFTLLPADNGDVTFLRAYTGTFSDAGEYLSVSLSIRTPDGSSESATLSAYSSSNGGYSYLYIPMLEVDLVNMRWRYSYGSTNTVQNGWSNLSGGYGPRVISVRYNIYNPRNAGSNTINGDAYIKGIGILM
ncbi:phage-related tail fiber protein [Paenibacillus rhizosphaerae]|uniref:Phage-related tail fiber protein n=1 Tax=Paenibacillus rhizosphaerae TaxID=297318 RepID=A0A839TZV7_9BACL|nr:tail fiber protein [Paenibacillus rhizosphaerae]MBB3132132.1 phage-related tail fiber protein [Paenibacillus rhizosphaerae]